MGQKVGDKYIDTMNDDIYTITGFPNGMIQLVCGNKALTIPNDHLLNKYFKLLSNNLEKIIIEPCTQSNASHNMKHYIGFTEEYYYCIFCNKKERS